MSQYVGCTVCGARWLEEASSRPTAPGCVFCGSSTFVLEANLTPDGAEIIKKHGVHPDTPTKEDHGSDDAFHWF